MTDKSVENAPAVCVSCAQPLFGRYCSHCGEQVLDPHALTVRHFLQHTLLHEGLHLDGKLWRTLRGLFRPAFLSQEYGAGRRRLYVSPLKLLATAVVVYALATRGGLHVSLFLGRVSLSIAPAAVNRGASVEETVAGIDRFGVLGRLLAARQRAGRLATESAREEFHRRLEAFAEPLSFANVLLLAFVLFGLFHRRRGLFVEHGVFSMHFVSFVLFSSLMFVPVPWLLSWGWNTAVPLVILVGVIWQFVYLSVGIRRFYLGGETGRFRPVVRSLAAALLIYLLNSVFVTAVQSLGGALALWSL
jgi:uncharacterized protein DUF3667